VLEEVEQAVISMYAANESKKVKSIRFKGKIGQTPVCALLDSGSTHSFVNPEVLKGLTLPITQATRDGGKWRKDGDLYQSINACSKMNNTRA
jgi:hypothetical protein